VDTGATLDMTETMSAIKVFKNGKVMVRRGIVTATVDPRKKGMERWHVEVRPPGRFKPRIGLVGYRSYYGPFEQHGKVNPKTITEQDGWTLAKGTTTENKLKMAEKMLNWHFYEESKRVGQ
jgi:hypothetical protein